MSGRCATSAVAKVPPRLRVTTSDQLDLAISAAVWCGQVESWASEHGHDLLVGLDEAGRGPLAGPVVAAAVALPTPCPLEGLDDSKLLDEARREALFEPIKRHALAYGIAAIEPDELDRINILQASLKAMGIAWQRAIIQRPELRSALAIIDGNQRAHLPADVAQRPIVKGDARSLNIAAASILAKVTRDRRMVIAGARWPEYGFAGHKGYPTKSHRATVARIGACALHRRSFRLPGVNCPLPGA